MVPGSVVADDLSLFLALNIDPFTMHADLFLHPGAVPSHPLHHTPRWVGFLAGWLYLGSNPLESSASPFSDVKSRDTPRCIRTRALGK